MDIPALEVLKLSKASSLESSRMAPIEEQHTLINYGMIVQFKDCEYDTRINDTEISFNIL